MWLLKLHFSISVLCLLAFLGIRKVWGDTIKENGYQGERKKKLVPYWLFFAPGINIFMVVIILLMSAMKKEDLEKKLEEMRQSEADNGEASK